MVRVWYGLLDQTVGQFMPQFRPKFYSDSVHDVFARKIAQIMYTIFLLKGDVKTWDIITNNLQFFNNNIFNICMALRRNTALDRTVPRWTSSAVFRLTLPR